MAPVCPAIMLEGTDLRVILQILPVGIASEGTCAQVEDVVSRPQAGFGSFKIFAAGMADTE